MKYPARKEAKLDSGKITVGMARNTPNQRVKENLTFARKQIELARDLCMRTLSRMSKPNNDVLAYAQTYFLIQSPAEYGQFRGTISKSIELIRDGLMGDVLLKVYTATTKEGRDAYGYVKSRKTNDPKGNEAQNIVRKFQMQTDANNKHYSARKAGSIHILSSRLCDENLGVQTLLHEASHRYAGTHDGNDDGYFESDGTPGGSFALTDVKAAVHNADSFGWFIVKTGRLHDNVAGIAI